MIKVISLNPDPIYLVVSRCLKSQYQRNSIVNFLKATGGRAATAVIVRFVKRFKELCPRLEGYSTALSSRYDGWGGLYDNHGQHTMLLLRYD